MAGQPSAGGARSVSKDKSTAGFSDGLAEKIEDLWNSFGNVKYGRKDPASRAFTVGSQFTLGTMAINAAQFLGAPLALINEDWHNDWIKFNKEQWGLLITTMTHWWSPTLVRVCGDKSVRGQLSKSADGQLVCTFSERMILIANHQIYTDWLYLWYIGYANGLHGHIHVVMKESLRKLPFVGWGMTLSKFIFLKRNWEQDKDGLAKHLETLNKPDEPMWLMFFPEGTNLAQSTREKSKSWADKIGIKDMQHVLLPRSTGLRFCLLNLRETVDYLYDCTIAYEGVPRGEYAQDIYTLQSAYISGQPPKSVNMHWRRFKISAIPLDDPQTFDLWLRARWTEKDALMEYYMRNGRFPADIGSDNLGEGGQKRQGAGHIETQVKPNKWYEILQVFAPIATIAIVLYYFYNKALPTKFFDSATDWAGYSEEDIKKLLRIGPAPKIGKPKTVSSEALENTLRPPKLQDYQKLLPEPAVTPSVSQKSPLKIPAAHPKPASSRAGSISSVATKNVPSLATSTPKPTIKVATPQNLPTPNNKPATNSTSVGMGSSKSPSGGVPKQKAPLTNTAAKKPPVKVVPDPKASVNKGLSQKSSSKEDVDKDILRKTVPSQKTVAHDPPSKKMSSKEAPLTKPKPNASTPTGPKKDVPVKKPQAQTTPLPAQKPAQKPAGSLQKPPASTGDVQKTQKSAVATKPQIKLTPTPKTSNVQKTQNSAATTKPQPKLTPTPKTTELKKIPKTTAMTKPKVESMPAPKTTMKDENMKKIPAKSNLAPRRPSIQTNPTAWSETTAVDDPWSERPSGKRLIKAQPTRKDRVKVAKKMQRQHLDHVTD